MLEQMKKWNGCGVILAGATIAMACCVVCAMEICKFRLILDQPEVTQREETQEDLKRINAQIIKNRNEYRREGAAERRKEMQDRARVESQQDDAWKIMDESLGLEAAEKVQP